MVKGVVTQHAACSKIKDSQRTCPWAEKTNSEEYLSYDAVYTHADANYRSYKTCPNGMVCAHCDYAAHDW